MDENATLGALDPELDALINSLPEGEESEEPETPEEDSPKEGKEEPVKAEEDKDGEAEEPAETKEGEEPDKDAEEEGYTIDGEEEDKPTEEEPTKTPEETPASGLTPEQKYILDNIQPIVVQGTVGDSKDIQEFKVLSPEQLPQGFRFTDDRNREIASKSFSMLESQAQKLQSDFKTQETAKSAQAFKEAEDAADRATIGDMQRDGTIGKFKADPDSADFDKDPNVELVQKVLDFKDTENQRYLTDSQNGKPYKHIGFEEAYYKFMAKNPPKSNKAQLKEDAERLAAARRTGKTSSTKADTDNEAPATFHNKREMENFLETLSW